MSLPRILLCALVAATVALVGAGSAHAGLLVKSVGPCEGHATERPFLRWLDPLNYVLVSGGTLEGGTSGWTLSGAAARASGNETYYVHGAGEGWSLALPAGSSATTPSTCVGILHPVLRFFARNTGSKLSTLRVEVLFEDPVGNVRALPIGLVVGTSKWQPTLPLPVVANLLPLLPGQYTAVAFRFTPQGQGGDWRIDDVYVDPRGRR